MNQDKPYKKSNEFKILEKLAELEKIVSGNILSGKDENGELNGLTSIRPFDNNIPEPIKKIIVIRRNVILPQPVLDNAIDDGFESMLSHINRHNIMLTPGEALYTAIGKKDDDIFDAIKNITLGEILSMAKNKAAVASTTTPPIMNLDDFDVPKYVKTMILLRGFSPSFLRKEASDSNKFSSSVDRLEFEFSNGETTSLSKNFVKKNSDQIQNLIDDGAIIKVVQVLSSGRKNTVYYNNPAIGAEDSMYLELLKGRLSQEK